MIKVTRLNHSEIVLNAELIETVEATPDTVITLTNGKKLVVSEEVDEIIRRVMEYRRHAYGLSPK
ncbi:MAG: flagellar protein FlbD [Armatimonadota bacterium]|nr:MAG: flagellar protein FlbD [Armatimonadota bacterium]